jgi:YbbR domain-containing protein
MIRSIKNLFLRNWILKLISFLAALVLWLSLTPKERIFSEKTLTIPLELYNIPAEMELVEKPPATVDVKIRAPKSLIAQITPANVHAVLNLEKGRLDQKEYPLNESMISIPPGAAVKDIYPSQVNLKFEGTKEIMLDVEPNITGEVKEGLRIEAVRVTPPQVLIKGPASKVKDKNKVRTSPIDISGLSQSAEYEAVLIPPNPEVRLASSQTKVKVMVVLREERPEDKKGVRKKTQKK